MAKHTLKISQFFWPFYNIMHERVKKITNIGYIEVNCDGQKMANIKISIKPKKTISPKITKRVLVSYYYYRENISVTSTA